MPGWDMLAGGFAMAFLVVEEKISAKGPEEFTLRQAAKEERLVDANIPSSQGADYALVSRCATSRDQGGADG